MKQHFISPGIWDIFIRMDFQKKKTNAYSSKCPHELV